jgi:hypothetical protein
MNSVRSPLRVGAAAAAMLQPPPLARPPRRCPRLARTARAGGGAQGTRGAPRGTRPPGPRRPRRRLRRRPARERAGPGNGAPARWLRVALAASRRAPAPWDAPAGPSPADMRRGAARAAPDKPRRWGASDATAAPHSCRSDFPRPAAKRPRPRPEPWPPRAPRAAQQAWRSPCCTGPTIAGARSSRSARAAARARPRRRCTSGATAHCATRPARWAAAAGSGGGLRASAAAQCGSGPPRGAAATQRRRRNPAARTPRPFPQDAAPGCCGLTGRWYAQRQEVRCPLPQGAGRAVRRRRPRPSPRCSRSVSSTAPHAREPAAAAAPPTPTPTHNPTPSRRFPGTSWSARRWSARTRCAYGGRARAAARRGHTRVRARGQRGPQP